jgi:hypothetical protein
VICTDENAAHRLELLLGPGRAWNRRLVTAVCLPCRNRQQWAPLEIVSQADVHHVGTRPLVDEVVLRCPQCKHGVYLSARRLTRHERAKVRAERSAD